MKKTIESNQSFILGLAVGVAVIAAIGFFVMLGLYLDKGESAADTERDTAQVADNQPSQPTPPATPPPSAGEKVDIKVASNDWIRGKKDAPITIIEFSDFQCPFCSKFHETMQQVMQNFPNDVRWVYKHFPLDSIHPYARKAAEASECAGEQGKFWEYADGLIKNQSSISKDYFPKLAGQLGLNVNNFSSCLDLGKYADKVNNDFKQGQAAGVRGTPGSFINGEAVKGAVPYSTIEAMIKNLL